MVRAVTPIPFVKARFFDRCGKPLTGGQIYTYEANTTTPKVTYKDPYGLTPNTNPIILDAAGEADIYLDGTYRIRITDRNDVLVNDVEKIGSWFSDNLQDTLDNISGAMDDALKPILQNLDEAINTAAAAGAGANGWTDLLIKLANGRTLRDKITEIVSVKDFGAKGDGVTDDTQAIQAALDAMKTGNTLNFGDGNYLISQSLVIKYSNVTLKGNYCNIHAARDSDIVIFKADNLININIEGIESSNTNIAQTFIKATSTNHLHISKCNIDGTKLFADLYDCYWFSTDKIRMQSTWQAFNFRGAVTAFDLRNTSISGSGIPSYIEQSIGGNISGCSFESKSGRLKIVRSFGLNISGNYFEGYDATAVDNYIEFGGGNYKTMNGVSVTGNLFYAGAKAGIKLNNVDGINIAGNYFGTTHAVELYSFDASNQTNCSYIANNFKSTPDKEFLISGKTQQASLSPEYGMPILFKQQQIGTRTLNSGEAQIYNKNGALAIKTPTVDSSIATFSDIVTFFQTNKMFVNKTYPNMLTNNWLLVNATSQADPSLSGALLITLTGGIALVRQTVATVVNNKYYLAARVKINNPMVLRLGYTDGRELDNYPKNFEYTTKIEEYKYLTVAFTATSASSTVGFTADEGKSGDTFNVVDWVLIDLTAKYGAGKELSKDMLDSAIKL